MTFAPTVTRFKPRRGVVLRALRRLAFPLSLVAAAAVAFVVLGPLSAGPTHSQRLAALAPPGAGDGPFAAPAGASATELEIAERYETVRRFPETVDAYVLLGNAYLQQVRETGDPSDYGRAAAAFDEALRRDPEHVNAIIGQGALALARHEFRKALELGQQAVHLAPRTARAHGVLVDALTELGRYEEAVVAAQTMVDLRPDLASLSRVSYQRELHGDVAGAVDAMSRAFDAAAGTLPENREYVRVLIGDLQLLAGDINGAERTYAASLAVAPDFVWALAGMGRVHAARGELEEAIGRYERAVEILPLPEFLVGLGEAQAAAGRDADARQTFDVVAAIQSLFETNGVNVDLELALFEASHGDPEKAVDLARRAYAAQPNVKAADALAWALQRAGRSSEAAAHSREALRLGTPYGRFHFHAGMIAAGVGDVAAAREHLKRAIVSPDLSPVDRRTANETLDVLEP